jgi:hypothetical protein
MTQDEIIEMANKAYAIDDGKPLHPSALFHLEIFAKLVAQHEREACAKLCDLALFQCQETMNELDATEHIAQCIVQGAMNQAVKLSNAIRARGQA